MALKDIDDLPDSISEGSTGHITDTNKVYSGLKSLKNTNRVKLKTLWTPYGSEVYPASDVTTYVIDDDAGYPSIHPNGYLAALWNDTRFNTQVCKWIPVDAGNPAAGARNNPTTRSYTGAVTDFSFEYTGKGLTFMTAAYNGSDYTIYASDEMGIMRRIAAKPKLYTGGDSFKFIHVKFATLRTRKIRYVAPHCNFYQVLYDSDGQIRKCPDLPLIVSVSDSFREAAGMKNVGPGPSYTFSAESYHTGAINDWYCERTGWAIARLGQGGTGYFNNATGTASNAAGPDGSRPFFSDENVNKIKAFGKNNIRIIDVNGTINDGSISGGRAGMKARVLEGINKIYSWDSGIKFILWGPEPFNDSYQPGNPNAENRLGIMDAAAEHPAVIGFVDTNHPTLPFYTGLGSEAAPVSGSLQTLLTGQDGIHYNYAGGLHYAHLGLDIIGEFDIEPEREVVE